jgi:GMP synthase-like glutamine amidotransferase
MRVLIVVHGANAGPGVFADEIAAEGGEVVERSFATGNRPEEAPSRYDALVVMGGSMNVHELDGHPWLAEERRLVGDALDAGVPILGICLGSQLLAAVAGGEVTRAPEPEIGWYEVETLEAAAGDPVLGGLPERFTAYQWHSFQSDVPPDAVALAASRVCLQAYRLGESAWGTQFHPEVTHAICESWISNYHTDPDAVALGFDPDAARADVARQLDAWNELGRSLMRRFLGVVSR